MFHQRTRFFCITIDLTVVCENELPLLHVVFFLLKNSSSTSIFSLTGCWLQLSSSFKPSNCSEHRVTVSSVSSNKLLTPPITEKLEFDSSWWPACCCDNWDRNFPEIEVIFGLPESADTSSWVVWEAGKGLVGLLAAVGESLSVEESSPFLSSLSYP